MSKLIRLTDPHQPRPTLVHFNRTELTLMLDLYTRRVAEGEWRDYAIDQGPGKAVFSVYRDTREHPAFAVAKLAPQCGHNGGVRPGGYVAMAGGREIARSGALSDVLAALERAPRLVVTQAQA